MPGKFSEEAKEYVLEKLRENAVNGYVKGDYTDFSLMCFYGEHSLRNLFTDLEHEGKIVKEHDSKRNNKLVGVRIL